MNLGEKIDKLYELRGQKAEIQAQLKEVQADIDKLEWEIIENMQSVGIDKTATNKATVSVKAEMYPQVKDMNAFVEWCAKTGRAEMIQKRVSSGVFKEYFEQTGEYPDGVDTYNRIKLSFRKK